MSLKILLDRDNRTYIPGDVIKGVIQIECEKGMSHSGLKFIVEGVVNMQYTNSKNSGLWDTLVGSVRPIEVIRVEELLEKNGKFPSGGAEVPFEFALKPTGKYPLYETYHGVYLSIRYRIHVDLVRGMFKKDLKKSAEFIVNVPGQGCPLKKADRSMDFVMRPEKLENVRKKSLSAIPTYRIEGRLESLCFWIEESLRGYVCVKESEVDIKSVELQLVRVETCVAGDGRIREATEIQNLQIGEGNVPKNLNIPVFMIPPRLFSCPTLKTKNFSIEFEINLIVLFVDGHQITENFPLRLFRKKIDQTKKE